MKRHLLSAVSCVLVSALLGGCRFEGPPVPAVTLAVRVAEDASPSSPWLRGAGTLRLRAKWFDTGKFPGEDFPVFTQLTIAADGTGTLSLPTSGMDRKAVSGPAGLNDVLPDNWHPICPNGALYYSRDRPDTNVILLKTGDFTGSQGTVAVEEVRSEGSGTGTVTIHRFPVYADRHVRVSVSGTCFGKEVQMELVLDRGWSIVTTREDETSFTVTLEQGTALNYAVAP